MSGESEVALNPRGRTAFRVVRRTLLASGLAATAALASQTLDLSTIVYFLSEEAPGGRLLQTLPQDWQDFIFRDYPAIAAFIVVFAIAGLAFNTKLSGIADRALHQILPEPPPFLDSILEYETTDFLDARASNQPFVGRDVEMAILKNFSEGDSRFEWLSLCGRQGIGKTRLAVEWLKVLRNEGAWDVGFLKGAALPRRWRFRRHTAVVIEAGETDDSTWHHLEVIRQIAIRAKFKVRVIICDVAPWSSPLPPFDPTATKQIVAARYQLPESYFLTNQSDELRRASKELVAPITYKSFELRPLDLQTWLAINPTVSEATVDGIEHSYIGAGIPLFAKLGHEPWQQLEQIAAKQLNQACGILGPDIGPQVLALAALAGPVDSRFRHSIAPGAGDVGRLVRLLPQQHNESARDTLPALKPDMMADQILLQACASLQEYDVERIFTTGLEGNRRATIDRVSSLWLNHPIASVDLAYFLGGQDAQTAQIESLGFNRTNAFDVLWALQQIDNLRTVHCEEHCEAEALHLLNIMLAASSVDNPPLEKELTLNSYRWLREEVTTNDGIPFNFQKSMIASFVHDGLQLLEAWHKLDQLTTGWTSSWRVNKVRLEAANALVLNCGFLGPELDEATTRQVAGPIAARFPDKKEVTAYFFRRAERQALLFAGDGDWGAIREILERPKPNQGHITGMELAANRCALLMRYAEALANSHKPLEAWQACEEAFSSAAEAEDGLLSWIHCIFGARNLLRKERARPEVVHWGNESLAVITPIWEAYRSNEFIANGFVHLLSEVALANAQHQEGGDYKPIADLANEVVSASPHEQNQETLFAMYAQIINLPAGAPDRNELVEAIQTLAMPSASDSKTVCQFWTMISHLHAMGQDFAISDYATARLRVNAMREIFEGNQSEPKFQFWFADGLAMAAKALRQEGDHKTADQFDAEVRHLSATMEAH